jgi:hypothetical protein
MQFLVGSGIKKVRVWGVAHLYLFLDRDSAEMWQMRAWIFVYGFSNLQHVLMDYDFELTIGTSRLLYCA